MPIKTNADIMGRSGSFIPEGGVYHRLVLRENPPAGADLSRVYIYPPGTAVGCRRIGIRKLIGVRPDIGSAAGKEGCGQYSKKSPRDEIALTNDGMPPFGLRARGYRSLLIHFIIARASR